MTQTSHPRACLAGAPQLPDLVRAAANHAAELRRMASDLERAADEVTVKLEAIGDHIEPQPGCELDRALALGRELLAIGREIPLALRAACFGVERSTRNARIVALLEAAIDDGADAPTEERGA